MADSQRCFHTSSASQWRCSRCWEMLLNTGRALLPGQLCLYPDWVALGGSAGSLLGFLLAVSSGWDPFYTYRDSALP